MYEFGWRLKTGGRQVSVSTSRFSLRNNSFLGRQESCAIAADSSASPRRIRPGLSVQMDDGAGADQTPGAAGNGFGSGPGPVAKKILQECRSDPTAFDYIMSKHRARS